MKQKILVLLWMLSCCFSSYAQCSPVFSLAEGGRIVPDADYVVPFEKCTYEGITPYILKTSDAQTTSSGDAYAIRCLQYNHWENDPGDFHVVEISSGGKSLLTLENPEGWEFFRSDAGFDINSYPCYGRIDLDGDAIALLFTGVNIMSQPPYCTVVILKGGKATLVYNQPAFINDIRKSGDETVITLEMNTVEWIDEHTRYNDPILNKLILKEGMMYLEK